MAMPPPVTSATAPITHLLRIMLPPVLVFAGTAPPARGRGAAKPTAERGDHQDSGNMPQEVEATVHGQTGESGHRSGLECARRSALTA